MKYDTFEDWVTAHTPATHEEVIAQLTAIPVGKWGVAGLKGSNDHSGPGVIVKRTGESEWSWHGLIVGDVNTMADNVVAMYHRSVT